MDDAIGRAAAAHFGGAAGPACRPRIGRWIAGGAIAAALGLATWIGIRVSAPRPAPIVAAGPMDLDGSGRVDILDAYALARRLDAGEAVPPTLDLDHDGAVDRRDVDVIALRAVALPGEAG